MTNATLFKKNIFKISVLSEVMESISEVSVINS